MNLTFVRDKSYEKASENSGPSLGEILFCVLGWHVAENVLLSKPLDLGKIFHLHLVVVPVDEI